MSIRNTHYKTMKEFYYSTQKTIENVIQRNTESPYPPKEENKDLESVINLEWSDKSYVNSADPEVWGPAFWFSLHNGAVRYPENASPITKERMKGFIFGIPVMLPCENCKEHATSHIEANWDKLDDIVSGRTKLFNFFVDFHNYVNKRYNKPIMSYKDAFKLYTGKSKVSKLSYN